MVLNRALQQEILTQAAHVYPFGLNTAELLRGVWKGIEINELAREVQYLVEHGLLAQNALTFTIANTIQFINIQITSRGLDFLQEDGGLSTILNVVTVKFEADTLKALLTSKIDAADIPADEKSELMKAVEGLPADGLRHLMTKVLDKGMDSIPHLMPYLSQALNSM